MAHFHEVAGLDGGKSEYIDLDAVCRATFTSERPGQGPSLGEARLEISLINGEVRHFAGQAACDLLLHLKSTMFPA